MASRRRYRRSKPRAWCTAWARAERLVTSPAPLSLILAGEAAAGTTFGALPALLPLAAGWGLDTLAFVTLGVLLAALVSARPSQVMMLSNLVRLC